MSNDIGFLTATAAINKLVQERDTRQIRQVVKTEIQGFQGGRGGE